MRKEAGTRRMQRLTQALRKRKIVSTAAFQTRLLPCCGQLSAVAGLVHGALQNPAMLIHLAQFALGVDFVSAVYQQLVNNQSTARAYAELIFGDR